MKNFNTFEAHVSEILFEGKFTDILKSFAPDVFNDIGLVTNTYNPNKNYYPNIRGKGAFGGAINLKDDQAKQAVIDYVNKLKQQENLKQTSIYNGYEAAENAEGNIKKAFNNIKNIYKKMPKNQSMEDFITEFNKGNLLKHLDPNTYDKLKNNIKTYTDIITNFINSTSPLDSFTFEQKGYIKVNGQLLINAATNWQNNMDILISGRSGNYAEPIDGTNILTKEHGEIKIIKDKWDGFLNNLINSIVGMSQRGWSTGVSPYSLISGKYTGTYKSPKKGETEYSDITTIAPNTLKEFHNDIMVPLFLKKPNNVLLYLTPEQWESISKGGFLKQATQGALHQIRTAADHRSKVTL